METGIFLSSRAAGKSLADNIECIYFSDPSVTYAKVAEILSVSTAYVRKVAQRRNLSFNRKTANINPNGSKRRNKTLETNPGDWDAFLLERWADRPKRQKVEKPPRAYQASGRQGSLYSSGYRKII